MTSIHIHQTAVAQAEASARAEVTPRQVRTTKPEDKDLMYAWSIGVTSAAKQLVEQAPQEHDASCPPEVYIG